MTTSSTTDKVSGYANDAIGNAKQGIGKAIGSEKLQAEGLAQEAKGEAQKASAAAKETVKDTTDKVADTVNKAL